MATAGDSGLREIQAINGEAATTAISWTGGKDCNLALLAAWRNPDLNVEFLIVFCLPHKDSFRAHPIAFMEDQAARLDLPIHYVTISETKDYKAAYVTGLESLQRELGLQVVVTGDMDLVGSMPRNWMTECCEACCENMRTWLPLWHANRGTLLQQLLDENFRVIFSCVKSPWFDELWIGQELDEARLQQMKEKSLLETGCVPVSCIEDTFEYKPLDLGGEGGEYHTVVLDGPLYQSRCRIVKHHHIDEAEDDTATPELISLSAEELQRPVGHPDDLSWWPKHQKWWALAR